MTEEFHCRSCGKRVVWARHATTGKLSILDADPDDRGAFVVEDGVYRAAREHETDRRTSHFATCPTAHRWRR